MKTINDIKDEKGKKVDQLIKDCKVFFAFSNEQFAEGKCELAEGDKYAAIGCGGYMPASLVPVFKKGMADLDLWFKNEVKANKARKAHIIYELYNHEAFYTGSVDDTLDALGHGYTRAEVVAAYRSEYKKATA